MGKTYLRGSLDNQVAQHLTIVNVLRADNRASGPFVILQAADRETGSTLISCYFNQTAFQFRT